MKATLLLADAAQAAEGKLYVLGGGWSVTGPGPAPMANSATDSATIGRAAMAAKARGLGRAIVKGQNPKDAAVAGLWRARLAE